MRERMALDEWRKRKLVDLDVPPFLASFWRMYPQHFALIYMMLVTGLRPSSSGRCVDEDRNAMCSGTRACC